MFLKNRNISSKIKRSKVIDYAALNALWRQNFAMDSAGFLLKHKRVKLE